MKVWIKYIIGIALGLIVALILPVDNAVMAGILSFLNDLVIHIGRYVVVPLIFCTTIVSFNKLRSSKLILKTSIWTFSIIFRLYF